VVTEGVRPLLEYLCCRTSWKERLKEYRVLDTFFKKENVALKTQIATISSQKDKYKEKSKKLSKKAKTYFTFSVKFCKKYKIMRSKWLYLKRKNWRITTLPVEAIQQE
jgi:hypothetical protein